MNPQPFIASLLGHPIARRLADAGFSRYARRRMMALDAMDVPAVQERTLLRFVERAKQTHFGQDHDLARIHNRADYRKRVPLRTYEEFWTQYWQPWFPHLTNVTWPGAVPYMALSSGTTSGVTKYIPVSRDMLASNRKAGFTTLGAFRNSYLNAELFSGTLFFLGGSTDLEDKGERETGKAKVWAGDLSGIAAREIPGWLRPYVYPPTETALLADWDTKLQVLAEQSARLPVTMISGVPAWLLVLFNRLKAITGKDRLGDIWPTLRLIVHGGVMFDPYRKQFEQEVDSSRVRLLETYPCSEGFVAFEDPRHELLRLLPDHGIYFEFVPVEELHLSDPIRHDASEIELGVEYAVVVTTCAGLWSYVLGDTIVFESRRPPLLRFTGRTRYYLSAFGEHLISEEVERAVAAAADAAVLDFHVGPLFSPRREAPGRHLYIVEFARGPKDEEQFIDALDERLCLLNDDYRAHRAGDLGIGRPELLCVAPGGFSAWLRSQGKLGGQHKVPRMDNTGTITEEIVAWMEHNHWTRKHPVVPGDQRGFDPRESAESAFISIL